MEKLSPAATSGSLKVAVGRLRKMGVGDYLYSVLTVGDQLLLGGSRATAAYAKYFVVAIVVTPKVEVA